MVNLYCSVEDVAQWLNVEVEELNYNRVENLIRMKMDWIDKAVRMTFNGNRRLCKEYATAAVAYWRGSFFFGIGIPIYLSYTNIDKMLKVEVYNLTNSAEDITANEGRSNGAYWVDRINGVLFLRTWVFPLGGREVYVEYTYGRDDLPGTIKEMCILEVVRDIILNDKMYWSIGSNESVISLKDMLNEIDERLAILRNEYRPLLPATQNAIVYDYYVEDTTTP